MCVFVSNLLVLYKISQFSSKIHVLENPKWYPLKFAHTLRRPDTGILSEPGLQIHLWMRIIDSTAGPGRLQAFRWDKLQGKISLSALQRHGLI